VLAKSIRYEYLATAIEIIASASIGFLLASIVLIVLGYDPIEAYAVLFRSALEDSHYVMARASFILLTGLAFSIPALAGLFNIGAEGQMYVGGLFALLATLYVPNPLVGILAGILGGVAYSAIAGLLRSYRNVNEVISTIMLNWISYYVVMYLILTRFANPMIPHMSRPVPELARLGDVGGVPVIFIISVAVAIIMYVVIYYTKIGYTIRACGLNVKAAQYAGIDPKKPTVLSVLIGGGMAGLAGALNVIGFTYAIDVLLSSMHGMGFDGIGVALLGRNHPIGIIFSAIFFSALIVGSHGLQMEMGIIRELADATIGIIIVALAIPYAYRMLVSYFRIRRMRVE